MNKFIIIINLLLYGIVVLCLYIMFILVLWKICSKFSKIKRKKRRCVPKRIVKKQVPILPPLTGEQLGALSQIEAWKNQIMANLEYVKHLRKEIQSIKTRTVTVEGGYDYLAIAKIHKKIATVESQSAGIEMRMRKLAEKYDLQKELDDF